MSTPIASRTPAEFFAALLKRLREVVMARGGGDVLSQTVIGLIIDRLRFINQRFARIAARIRDGRYVFRTVATPRSGTGKPRPPDPLPKKFGWLLKLVPDSVGSRSQLEYLFRDPEMAALLEAAPKSLGRPLRSLCHMLGLRPPEILAPPARPPKPRKPRPAKAAKPPPLPPIGPPPPHPDAPAWMHMMPPSRTRWLPARSRSPKNRP
jgi:hypothetical protein